MGSIEGFVATTRADRYLTQVVEHLGQLAGHAAHGDRPGPPPVLSAEHAEGAGRIVFSWGTCTLNAHPERLELRLDGDDQAALEHGAAQLARRVETIGRRDGLEVVWTQGR